MVSIISFLSSVHKQAEAKRDGVKTHTILVSINIQHGKLKIKQPIYGIYQKKKFRNIETILLILHITLVLTPICILLRRMM